VERLIAASLFEFKRELKLKAMGVAAGLSHQIDIAQISMHHIILEPRLEPQAGHALNVRREMVTGEMRVLQHHLKHLSAANVVMATHSPVFVSPSSKRYVARVYADHQRSKVVRLADSGLPEPKHPVQ
jgi:hypothetical protein